MGDEQMLRGITAATTAELVNNKVNTITDSYRAVKEDITYKYDKKPPTSQRGAEKTKVWLFEALANFVSKAKLHAILRQ